MSMNGKIKLLIFNSILITALPLLGLPRTIKNIILFAVGLVSLALVLSIKKRCKNFAPEIKKNRRPARNIHWLIWKTNKYTKIIFI